MSVRTSGGSMSVWPAFTIASSSDSLTATHTHTHTDMQRWEEIDIREEEMYLKK